jgi:hypothetical protein
VRNPISHSGQRLDELPRSTETSLQGTLDREVIRASQYRRDDDTIDIRPVSAPQSESEELAKFLAILRNATNSNVTELLATAPREIRLLCEMELFSHHIHVTDDIREHIVTALGVPDLRTQFENYKAGERSEGNSRVFDLTLTPYVLRYVEKRRRGPQEKQLPISAT